MLNYQAKLQTQVGLKFLREVLIRWHRSQLSLFGHSERHQGLKIKTSGLRQSYKSLKTAAVFKTESYQLFYRVTRSCDACDGIDTCDAIDAYMYVI